MQRSPSLDEVSSAAETVRSALRNRPDAYLVAISGIPGSGKSTLCEPLRASLLGAVVLPMDGYHLRKSQLDAGSLRRRGARHTFANAELRADLMQLRQTRRGTFPAFDHAEQDPRADAIQVTPATPLVIVEGLYLLMRDWQLEKLFDLRIFIDCKLEIAMERVAMRHLACGLEPTAEKAWERAMSNDRLNALDILEDGCRERADLVIPA